MEFRAAATSSHCQGFSGCNAVLKAVGEERAAGNPAWGIVDRDTVMSQDLWHLVHETDDARFESAQPFGAEIKTLCRWEMENYLADAEALEKCRSEKCLQPPRTTSAVHDELLEHCQVLVPYAALCAVSHAYKAKAPGDGYTRQFSTREAIDADIQLNRISKLPAPSPDVVVAYAQQVSNVERFDRPEQSSAQRFAGLMRRLNGKALLGRFAKAHDIQDDMKGFLANRIKECGRIPDELTTFVDTVSAGA